MAFTPKAAADACIARSRRFLDLADRAITTAEMSDDLCRFGLVNAVAAIDTFMHWLVFNSLSEVRYRTELPKSLARLNVPFMDLAQLADSIISAQQDERRIRPWVQVKNTVQKQLLQQTFQSHDQVGTALALAGIDKGWSKVSAEMGIPPAEIRDRLNHIIYRRNQIVHEGDITRASRPREIYHNEIDRDSVIADVDWIENLLNAIQSVVDAE